MNWLTEYISERIIHALGMTFLHSIWLGILAAFFVSIAFYLFKEKRADIRYNISRGVMMVFFLAVCCVFTIYYEGTAEYALSTIELADSLSETDIVSDSAMATETDLFGQVHGFLNQHAEALVLFWLIGIILLSIRFAGGFLYIRRLRTIGLSTVPDEWQTKMEEWGKKLGLKKFPSFHTSSLVTSPIAFGYIKPMVLFPLGMFTSMPVQHLDAMLMHELIHVKNADYITNLFLSVVEILLFFNPAVWWLSDVIRAEMEHRCDDMAVAMTGNKMSYAYALVAMQENKIFPKTELVLGMAKDKSQLTHRVNRLFGSKDGRSISYGRPIISLVVLLSSVLLLAFSSPEEINIDSKEELDLTFMLIDSLSKEYTTDLINKEEVPLPASSLSVLETMELFADSKPALVSEMNNSDDSFQNAYYYFNDKPVDKEAFYQKNEQPGGFSIGHIRGDSIELRFYDNKRMYDSLKGKVYSVDRIQLSNSNKESEEKILLVDGKERPMEFLDQLSLEANLGSIAVMTDKHAYDISPKYANKTVIVVRTKNGMKDTEYIKKEDSLRLAHYLRNETSIISERNTRNESVKISEKKKINLANIEKYNGYSYSPHSINLETPIQGLSVDNFDDRTKPVMSKYYALVAQSMAKRHKVNFGYDSRTRIAFGPLLIKSIEDSTELINRIKEKPGLTLMHKTVSGVNQSGRRAFDTIMAKGGSGFSYKEGFSFSGFGQNGGIAADPLPTYAGGKIRISTKLQKKIESDSIAEFEEDLSSIVIKNKERSQPLFIVDGEKVNDITLLDPNNIESISVLKGESATEVYGEEGQDGVVLITTKKRKETKRVNDTKLHVEHKVVERDNKYYLQGNVTGNITKQNVTNAFIRFDDNWQDTFHTDENGAFEILIPVGAVKVVIRHFMMESAHILIDREIVLVNELKSALEQSLVIYPNPTSAIVRIGFVLEENSEGKMIVDILSLDGKVVIGNLNNKKLKKGAHVFQWNTATESPGVYLVMLQNGKESLSRKVVVER